VFVSPEKLHFQQMFKLFKRLKNFPDETELE